MKVQGRAFPSVTEEWPFRDHFLNKTLIFTQRALCPRSEQ